MQKAMKPSSDMHVQHSCTSQSSCEASPPLFRTRPLWLHKVTELFLSDLFTECMNIILGLVEFLCGREDVHDDAQPL